MELTSFFRTVITTPTGWFCLAYRNDKGWKEEYYSWPDDLPKIINRVRQLQDYDVYFSPHLFSEKSSKKEYVLPTRTIVADLDEANVLTIGLKPSVLVETSLDRHQGYWLVKEELALEDYEHLSKRLTYSIPRCDRSGWWMGHKFRVPETHNHKYVDSPRPVRIVDASVTVFTIFDFENLPSSVELYGKNVEIDEENLDWANEALEIDIGPQELLASVRSSLPARIIAQYNLPAQDRSLALWALYGALFRAGLDRKKVLYLAYHSANNKFKDLKYGGVRELAKDVLRAEIDVHRKIPDIRSKINSARKLPGHTSEKNAYISKIIIEHMEKLGHFIHTNTDDGWYVREDTGRPIILGIRSDALSMLLESMFGMNGAEPEAKYVARSLMTHTNELPPTGIVATVSHYDVDTKTFYLHTGRKDVLKVTRDNIEHVPNGYSGLVFPWNVSNSIISPRYQAIDKTWDDILFDGCLNNIIGLKPSQAQAILKVWFLTILLRDGLIARPILALFGQPGSGKSTMIRRIYALLYGRDRSVNAVTREEDFDYAMSVDPLVVLDNVDTWARWLPDKIAIAAAPSEIVKRKLFTDREVVIIKRQAMLAITAHNPKFGREDVMDRLLVLNFERLPKFLPEAEIIDKIVSKRNVLWGAILQDISKVLRTLLPESGWPQFRVEDFARFGYWIATALGIQDDFFAGVEYIRNAQKEFVLEEDAILVDAIAKMVEKQAEVRYRSAGQLWPILEALCSDPVSFVRYYKNAVTLGKKLWTLQDALKLAFDVDCQYESSRGSRIWAFKEKDKVKANGVSSH